MTATTALAASALAAVAPSAVAYAPASGEARAPVNSCYTRDNGDPSLVSLRLMPAALDVTTGAATLKVKARLADGGGPGPASGAAHVSVSIDSPGNQSYFLQLRHTRGSTWAASQKIPQWSADGTYEVSSVYVDDKVRNSATYTYSDLGTLGFDRSVAVASVADDTSPTLTSITVSPKRVDTRQGVGKVTITATASPDAESGVHYVRVNVERGPNTESAQLRRVPGQPNTYRGTAKLQPWLGNGRWHLAIAQVYDRALNSTLYFGTELDALGGTHTFRVIGRTDSVRPTITAFDISARRADVRTRAQSIPYSVTVKDAGSGPAFAQVGLLDKFDQPIGLSSARVQSRNGDSVTYTGSIRLAPCTTPPARARVFIAALDAAQNIATANRGTVAIKAKDHQRPEASIGADNVGPSGPIEITFTEPVNGITATSVTIHADSSPTVDIPVDATCLNAASNEVTCQTGRVKSASFVPLAPFSAGQHTLTINPEGSLGVTDLAGNPFYRVGFFFIVS